jgi:hypothetical protein
MCGDQPFQRVFTIRAGIIPLTAQLQHHPIHIAVVSVSKYPG